MRRRRGSWDGRARRFNGCFMTVGCGGRAPGRWLMSDRWPNTSNHRRRPIAGRGRQRIATSGEAASAYEQKAPPGRGGMGGARRGVGIAQPVQLRLNPNLLSGAISPGRTSITPWAWPVGCADRSGFGQYQPGDSCNPRSASKPTCMPPRDYAGATPAGGDKIETGGSENYEALHDKHGAWSVRFTGTLVWNNDGCMERCTLLDDRRGVLGAATVGGKA